MGGHFLTLALWQRLQGQTCIGSSSPCGCTVVVAVLCRLKSFQGLTAIASSRRSRRSGSNGTSTGIDLNDILFLIGYRNSSSRRLLDEFRFFSKALNFYRKLGSERLLVVDGTSQFVVVLGGPLMGPHQLFSHHGCCLLVVPLQQQRQ